MSNGFLPTVRCREPQAPRAAWEVHRAAQTHAIGGSPSFAQHLRGAARLDFATRLRVRDRAYTGIGSPDAVLGKLLEPLQSEASACRDLDQAAAKLFAHHCFEQERILALRNRSLASRRIANGDRV